MSKKPSYADLEKRIQKLESLLQSPMYKGLAQNLSLEKMLNGNTNNHCYTPSVDYDTTMRLSALETNTKALERTMMKVFLDTKEDLKLLGEVLSSLQDGNKKIEFAERMRH